MDQAQQNPKHVNRFWAIFIIIVLAIVAAGVVFFYANQTAQQEDLNSLFFWSHFTKTSKTPTQTKNTRR